MLFARILATAVAAALLTATTSAAFVTVLPCAPCAPAAGGDQSASLSVGPDVLSAGKSATVTYVNPGMAGQTVLIEVDNGMQRGQQTSTIEMQLDACGKGSVSWTVPCWGTANFNAPGVGEVSCPVAN